MSQRYKAIILLAYISIASASAVIINPALPYISKELSLSEGAVEWLVSIFLIGYVIGQIIYSPLAKKYGDIATLRIGLSINIVGIIMCLIGGCRLSMEVLLIGRFVTAIGSSAGLVCTFIILNNLVEETEAKTVISFATISFTLSVSLAILIGGLINTYTHWYYCFYVLLVHGLIMFGLSFLYTNNKDASYKLAPLTILEHYLKALGHPRLIVFAMSLGTVSLFSYCYSAASPFITHQIFAFSSAEYGFWNTITSIGIILGSVLAAKIINKYSCRSILIIGLVALIGLFILLAIFVILGCITPIVFFILVTLMYFASSFIYPTASHLALSVISSKADASSAMNFVNMFIAVVGVAVMGYIPLGYIWKFILICIVLSMVCLMLVLKIKTEN